MVAGSELRSVFPSLAGTSLGRGTGLCCPPGQAFCLTLAGRFLVWLSHCQASGQAGPVKSSASYSGKRHSCCSFVVMSVDFPHPCLRSLLSCGKRGAVLSEGFIFCDDSMMTTLRKRMTS